MTLRSVIKRLTQPFLQTGLKLYYSKPRKFRHSGITVTVHPDVFPPQLTLSTKVLLDFLETLDLKGKQFLELGCGSGIISLKASQRGALATAIDINNTALEYLKKAAQLNQLNVEVLHSNLFSALKDRPFNYIIINPPYYPKKAYSVKDEAWFCGENFEYFQQLFQQLPPYLSSSNHTYIILSQDCDLDKIQEMARSSQCEMALIVETRRVLEMNYIFRIKRGSVRNQTSL